MRKEGLESAVIEHARNGLITGICGGMQMLGELIVDPEGVEDSESIRGLCLLPIKTTMRPSKITLIGTGQLEAKSLFDQPIGPVSLHDTRSMLARHRISDMRNPLLNSCAKQTCRKSR
jgi:adenosylcobyric acid synthase